MQLDLPGVGVSGLSPGITLETIGLFLAAIAVCYATGFGVVYFLAPPELKPYRALIAPTVGYTVYCLAVFNLSGGFQLPVTLVIWACLVAFVALSAAAAWRARVWLTWPTAARELGFAFALTIPALLVVLWPFFIVGAPTYLGAVNPDYFASLSDNYFLETHSIVDRSARATYDSYYNFKTVAGNILLSARFSSTLYALLLTTVLSFPGRTALTTTIAVFIWCLPLTVYAMSRVVFGFARAPAVLGALLAGVSGCVGMSYLYFYVGQNSGLSLVPLTLTAFYLLLTRFSIRALALSALLFSGFAVMYLGMLPYAVTPVGALGLYMIARRRMSIARGAGLAAAMVGGLVIVNLPMIGHMLAVFRGWGGIVGQSGQGQYFLDFLTEQFLPIFFGIAQYPVMVSPQVSLIGAAWIYLSLMIAVAVAAWLIWVGVVWARGGADESAVVVALAAVVIYGGVWWVYAIPREYGYAVFKMSTWLQFGLMPLVGWGIWRFWTNARAAGRRPAALSSVALAAVGVLVGVSNVVSSYDYGKKGLGTNPARGYIINNFQMSGNYDYLRLPENMAQFVAPNQSIGLGFSDSIQNSWVGYYLRDFRTSWLAHELLPGDDENLPDIITRRAVDYYGNEGFDQRALFHGTGDDFLLLPVDEHLNSDIVQQELHRPLWRDSTFQLLRGEDAPDFAITGRGFYRLEHFVPNGNYWWPERFRWSGAGGEIYLMRASQLGQPYRLSFVGVAGYYGGTAASRTVELWHNDKKFDEITVNGGARVLSAPFFPSSDVERLVIKVREPSRPGPRPFAFWNRHIPEDYRVLNLAVGQVRIVKPSDSSARRAALAEIQGLAIYDHALTFNGMEMNGWVRDRATLVLPRPAGSPELKLSLFVPSRPEYTFPYHLGLKVAGVPVDVAVAAPGDSTVDVPLPDDRTRTVELSLAPAQTFVPDGTNAASRPLIYSVRLNGLTFTPGPGGLNEVDSLAQFAAEGVDSDGWVTRLSALRLPPTSGPSKLRLQLEYPGWAGLPPNRVQAVLDGQSIWEETLTAGYATVEIPIPASRVDRTLELRGSSEFAIPLPDTRVRSLRIYGAELVSGAPVGR
jgi:hypothetical protein